MPAADSLSELKQSLSGLSHDESALKAIRAFSESLRDTRARLVAFNETNAMIRPPITAEQTNALGFNAKDEQFTLLQGDIITSESAYFMGERICSGPKYVVLNSSCDLIPERREFASLLRLKPIRRTEPEASKKLNLLLLFKRTDSLYLPVFPDDDPDVVCNVVQFDGICQVRSNELALAGRLASLSVVGWRIFASFSRVVFARANQRECDMREAIESDLFTAINPVKVC